MGHKISPVMITVANTTYTSARIKYAFDHDAFLLSISGLGDLCDKEKTLQIDSSILEKAEAELAAIIAGKPNPAARTEIDLKEIGGKFRLQSIIFRIASTIYHSEKKPDWKGSKEAFLIQLIGIIEQFIYSDKIRIKNPLFNQDEVRKRILIMLNMNKVIQHIWNEIRAENTTQITSVFDKEHPIRSTADMHTWWTSKPCEAFTKTHVNFTAYPEAGCFTSNNYLR